MERIIFESIFSLLEMLISLFFAAGIFHHKISNRRAALVLILFSLSGAALLTLREYLLVWIPDFVPAMLIFTVYAIASCRAKWWAAVSWALVNYLFIGIVVLGVDYLLWMWTGSGSETQGTASTVWFLSCLLMRFGQLLLSEMILCVWKRFPESAIVHRGSWKIVTVSSVSIILLWAFLAEGADRNEEAPYINSFVCLLVLAVNLAFMLFDEIIAREKRVAEELKAQNQLIALQMRNQDEVNNMYQGILSLKHDMNNHLHTISGYLQVGEYAKAQEYVGKIAGEVSGIKSFHSGNAVVDALIGSKTALAEMNGIAVETDMAVPSELAITDEELTVLIGNLYDNAIDANMRLTDVSKRFIQIKILYDSGNLLILFENAALQQSSDARIWATTKEDSSAHGFGIRNMDRIINKYGGYCERELKDHVFRCRIRIPSK